MHSSEFPCHEFDLTRGLHVKQALWGTFVTMFTDWSQKAVSITLPADLTFFKAGLPSAFHCFDCSVVSDV